MAKVQIDLRKIRSNPVFMMGLGAVGIVVVLLVVWGVSSAFVPRAEAVEPSPTATILPSPTPTATPLPTMIPTLQPTPVPVAYVWAADTTGAYLRQGPNGAILALLPNGASVELTDLIEKWGGLFWYQVWYGDQIGWIVADFVHQLAGEPVVAVSNEQGAFLRDAPQGNVITWLSQGTPIMQVLEEVEDDPVIWVKVVLPDQRQGWVARFLLAAFEGGGDG